jgi:hypothetical protein
MRDSESAMQNESRKIGFFSVKWQWFFVLASLLGIALVLISTHRYGAGLSQDSTDYIAVARNIIAGKGVIDQNGLSFIVQPPLYPALLALPGGDPLQTAPLANAVLLGLTVYLAGALFFRHTRGSLFTAAGVAAILATWSLAFLSRRVWSEIQFISLVLLFLLLAERYLARRNLPLLVLMAIVAALASLTRYIGITLMGSGVIIILLLSRIKAKARLLDAFLFGLVSTVPFALWILRNQQRDPNDPQGIFLVSARTDPPTSFRLSRIVRSRRPYSWPGRLWDCPNCP